jgi:hypothetical protein
MGWQMSTSGEWVCEVWQSAYGHVARKRTWLFYVGQPPPPLRWNLTRGTKQVSSDHRAIQLPTVTKREAIGTPPAFAEMLIALAENARKSLT